MIEISRHKSTSIFKPHEFESRVKAGWNTLSENEKDIVLATIGDQELYCDLKSTEYEKPVVPIQEWLQDQYFCGGIAQNIYTPWRNDLIELFSAAGQYQLAILGGSLAAGKSYVGQTALIRLLYEVSCLRDPAEYFGFAKNSILVYAALANNKETARRVVFEQIIAKVKDIPYFSNEFPIQRCTQNEIVFPKNIVILAGGATDSTVIGLNVISAILDETNFVRKVGNHGKIDQSWGDEAKIGSLFDSICRRIKSRSLKFGKIPGMIIVISSKGSQDSFTERLIRREALDRSTTTFVRERSVLEVKRAYFSVDVFKVLVGNETYPSRILSCDENIKLLPEDAIILEIPEDLRRDFENNLESNLREFCGVATLTNSSFMPRIDKINEIVDRSRTHPFISALNANPHEWDSRLSYAIQWQKLVRKKENGEWEPLINPEMKRHVHLDPAYSGKGDAFGLCIGHISDYREVKSISKDQTEITERQPVFYVDFVLRIKAAPHEQIYFKNVRQLLYEFSVHGFHLAKITTDTFQSHEMLAALRDNGFNADLLSVDKNKEPYYFLRTVIYENRLNCYDYPILLEELKRLEDTPLKIDHQKRGYGKDVSDALCGCIYSLAGESTISAIQPLRGISDYHQENTDNENFIPLSSTDGLQTKNAVNNPQVIKIGKYIKKTPKTLPPTYKKICSDGTEIDLSKPIDFVAFVRG